MLGLELSGIIHKCLRNIYLTWQKITSLNNKTSPCFWQKKYSTFDNSQWQRLHNSWSQKPMAPWGCQGSERKTKQVSQFPCGSILILTTRSLSTRFQLRCHYLYIYSNTLNIPPKKLSTEISWSKQLNFYFSWRFEIILFEDRTL